MSPVDQVKLRSWWFERQGLGRPGFSSAEQVLRETGWARSVGGANPYLTVFSRSGISRSAIEAELAGGSIHELPSARGCTYVVPSSDFALALTVAESFSNSDLEVAKRHLGYSDAEHGSLEEKVLRLLEDGPLDPRQMKPALGEAVRSFGEEGKKRGLTTNLPMALGSLQVKGLIRRIPVDGRLDTQRFNYASANLKATSWTQEEAFIELARRYFSWIGPASLKNFQWFSGLGSSAAKAAIAPLGLVALEADSDLLILPEDRDEFSKFRIPEEACVRLVASIDGLVHLRRETSPHIDEEDQHLAVYGEKGRVEMFTLMDLPHHGIFDRGRLIGLWEFDTEAGEIVADCFVPMNNVIKEAIDEMQGFIRTELGDARMVSLDSPEGRRPRIQSLRARSEMARP